MVMASRFGSTLPGAIIGPLRFPPWRATPYLEAVLTRSSQIQESQKALMPEGERHDDDPV